MYNEKITLRNLNPKQEFLISDFLISDFLYP